jgi:hypothetical protein
MLDIGVQVWDIDLLHFGHIYFSLLGVLPYLSLVSKSPQDSWSQESVEKNTVGENIWVCENSGKHGKTDPFFLLLKLPHIKK